MHRLDTVSYTHLNVITSLFPIRAGVPQGSVLGPILYVIYTTDLPNSNDVITAMYADNTAILAVKKVRWK